MKSTFKHILITGGAGYVGTALTELLLKKGYLVTVLDSLMFGGGPLIPFFQHKNFSFIKGDIRDKKIVEKSMSGIDAVIHLAAIVGYPACRKDPEFSHDVNVNGTKTLTSVIQGSTPILFASTGSVYGRVTDKICTEESPLKPISEYGMQKAQAEKILVRNKNFIIYRFATAFGVSPRMRLDVMPNDFTLRAVQDKSLIVYERKFMRTFIHVRDMARSFLFGLVNYKKMNDDIFNVGDETMNFTKEDICHIIQKKVPYYLHFADILSDLEQRDYWVSYDKFKKLGFRVSLGMEEGIDELIKVAEVLKMKDQYRNI